MNPHSDAPPATSTDPSATAGPQESPSRIVIVLGRHATLDPAPFIATAWRQRLKLLVLVLGLPLTRAQERVCEAALEAAGRRLIELEERVVLDPRRIESLVEDGDQVVLAVSPAERAQL